MPFRFDHEKAYHIILFLVYSLESNTDISKLFLLLYLADLKHLKRYGTLILGDKYIAMKYGPIPYNVFCMFKQIEQGAVKGSLNPIQKLIMSLNDKKQVIAKAHYDARYIAYSEVECMFEVIHKYKDFSFEELSTVTKDNAWGNANNNGDINLMDMAAVSEASEEMVCYINVSYRDEIHSFSQYYETE